MSRIFSAPGSGCCCCSAGASALFYHLCNGIRHLVWDTGHGLDLKSTYVGGWAVVAATGVLTLIAWIAGISRWVS